MQLTHIRKITGTLELLSGLHIGGGNTEMHIGGTDNPVIKNPVTNQPYIPGSSLKGKMRSLLEWRAGVVGITQGSPLGFKHIRALDGAQQDHGKVLLKLFGGAPEGDPDEALIKEIGPTRLAFWDCNLDPAWVADMDARSLLLTEQKTENQINRIAGVAEHPRNTERVPAGARFDFQLTLKVHGDEDLLEELLIGFKLLELTGLGGSGSRGYGKLRFTGLAIQGVDLQTRLDQLSLD
ncbi:type III-A CRISPR-associated RAMP protein Csm3 [Lamprobacter modestohalophilus]|uniref:type III-A CRISPR-associated RAMP protein Csm3 n=1 Tax=Lamprobacter modestohalophilus TaxID=1064514 RepID=UPI002ADEE2E9|nr:type III-A CRISPR-associated RAMP protein Csm3 [Lamprobacter modestohalophilus]MEA1051765.1 type III-A CRISPR-associated RAMP protein Csm3 [Lamprobacter modestohalophilus]